MEGARRREGEDVGGRMGPDHRGPVGLGQDFELVLRAIGKSLHGLPSKGVS